MISEPSLWKPQITLCASAFVFAVSISNAEILTQEARLEYGEKLQKTIEIPETKQGEPVYLSFDARIDAGTFQSGGTDALRLRVNGMPVTVDRLLNKQHQWIFGKRRFVSWVGANDSLKVLYYRWDQSAPELGRIHRYTFDITSLLRGGKGEVEFLATFAGIANAALELRKVEVTTGGEIERNPHPVVEEPLYLSTPLMTYREKAISYHRGVSVALETAAAPMDSPVHLDIAPPANAPDFPTKLNEDGSIHIGWEAFPLSVTLNVGLNGDGWRAVGSGTQGWETSAGTEGSVVFKSERLRIERRLERTSLGISLVDRVTNLTDSDLPLGLLYKFDLGSVEKLKEFRLFGRTRPTFYANTVPDRESATVPTVWLRNDRGSVGLLMEDDRMRNLTSYLAWDDTLALGSDMTYLKPGAAHEFRWGLSPGDEEGYFGFLNKIRAYWQTYQEIPGLFGFVYPAGIDKSLTSPEKVAAFLERTGITNPCLPPALDASRKEELGGRLLYVYGQEKESELKEAIEPMERFIKMAREGGVQSPFAFYTDMHLVSVGKEEGVLDPFKDSLVTDYLGNLVEYREGWLYNLLPQRNNYAGANFKKTVDLYLNTPGVSGIFLDEWDHSRARYAFNFDDGVTALLDDDFKIRRKIGLIPLMVKEYQAEVVDQLRKHNAIIYANQFDSTRLALDLPVVHFAEPTQYDSYLLCGAQMGRTPLSLTVKRGTTPWQDVREFLKHGVLTCFYARRLEGDHLLKQVYPITARKLGPGYVVGTDRILTLRSGTYSLGSEEGIRAEIFGGNNGLRLRSVEAKGEPGQTTKLEIELDQEQKEVAIIKAIPNVPEQP